MNEDELGLLDIFERIDPPMETMLDQDEDLAMLEFYSEREPEVVCGWNKRRKCDSFYISIARQLKRRNDKVEGILKELKDYLEKGVVDSKAGSSQCYYYLQILKFIRELEDKEH